MQALSYTFPDAITPSYLPLYLLLAFFLFGFGLMKSRNGHTLTLGLDSPTRSNKTWCYLQLTTHSGQRHVSHNVLGTDCKVYRQQIIQLLGL